MEGDNKNNVVVTQDDTKTTIRNKVWDYLKSSKLADIPLPPHKRIPNYKTAKETSIKLLELDAFSEAKSIKIDPDKPLQHVRFNSLEKSKTIFVPTPRLMSNFLNKLTSSDNSKKNWILSTKLGLINNSTPMDLENIEKIDLVIVGAVAVSPKGWRIGKGEGYSDLEHAVMSVMGIIGSDVKIIACVHDCQVIDDMPDKLFEQHDVPVDIIVTPTRIIHCEGTGKPKPNEVFWNLLSIKKFNAIPVLKKLRYKIWKECTTELKLLSDETEAPKELMDEKIEPIKHDSRYPRSNYSRGREFYGGFRGRRPNSYNKRGNYKNANVDRNSRRLRRKDTENENEDDTSKEKRNTSRDHDGGGDTGNEENQDRMRKRGSGRGRSYGGGSNTSRKVQGESKPHGGYRRQGDGWVYIGNIPKNVRVSDFKSVVRGCDKVAPLQFIWKGAAGFAFINFKTVDDAKEATDSMAGLKISDTFLKVEMARDRENKSRRRKDASETEKSQKSTEGDDKEVTKALDEDVKISEKAN